MANRRANREALRNAAARRRESAEGHSSAYFIPEEIQVPIRRRLKMMRNTKGLTQRSFSHLGSGAVGFAENHDISTLKVASLYSMAADFGERFGPFMSYLFGDGEGEGLHATPEAENRLRMNVMMRTCSLEEQQLILELAAVVLARREKRSPSVTRTMPAGARAELAALRERSIANGR